MFGGTIPTWKAILVSCDEKYFIEHFPPLAYSAVGAGERIHAHVVNPTQECHGLAKILEEDIGATYSFERRDLSGVDPRTYYACSRFLILPEFLHHGMPEALVLDTDCLIMNEIDWSPFENVHAGLFFREALPGTHGWESQGTKIAAGAVYAKRSALEFTIDVRYRITQGPFQWFIDQVALNESYEKHKDTMSFYGIPPEFMDWNFVENTTIWTGKGDRKYKDVKYLNAKDTWREQLNGARERIWNG